MGPLGERPGRSGARGRPRMTIRGTRERDSVTLP